MTAVAEYDNQLRRVGLWGLVDMREFYHLSHFWKLIVIQNLSIQSMLRRELFTYPDQSSWSNDDRRDRFQAH